MKVRMKLDAIEGPSKYGEPCCAGEGDKKPKKETGNTVHLSIPKDGANAGDLTLRNLPPAETKGLTIGKMYEVTVTPISGGASVDQAAKKALKIDEDEMPMKGKKK